MISVLFICYGNVCRSPALQGFFEDIVKKNKRENDFHVESCGMASHFWGHPIDGRVVKIAEKKGVHLEHKAIAFEEAFLHAYDYIFLATYDAKKEVEELAKKCGSKAKIFMATHYSEKYKDKEIPDPFYESEGSFEYVVEIIVDAVEGIYKHFEEESC